MAAGAAATAAGAQPPRVVLTLNDPTAVHAGRPPLAGTGPAEREPQLFHQRVDSTEHIAVGIDGSGVPVSVSVVQRLRVIGTGDYQYYVPAPVLSVLPTGDSASTPGQRAGAIVWSGFSASKRLLGATARLSLRESAPYLPLRVSIRADGKKVVLRLTNVTETRVQTATARGDVQTIAHALDLARRNVYPHGGIGISVVQPVKPRTAVVEAPLAVRGEISFRGGRVARFSFLLGDGAPLTRTIRVAERGGPPTVRVTATPVDPQRTIVPPRGSTWAQALRLDAGFDPIRLLTVAEDAYLRAARVHDYHTFLANPGYVPGVSTADYTYVSAAPHRTPAVAAHRGGGAGTLALALVLIVAGGVLLVGGLTVAWAHL